MTHYRHSTGLRGQRRRQAMHRAQRIIIALSVFVIMLTIAGAAYTWWMGRREATTAPIPEQPKTVTSQVRKPFTPDPNAPVGVAVQSLTTPISPGQNVALSIHTTAEAICSVAVEYNKVPVKDSGLTEKVADEYGVANWSWTVSLDAPYGTWPVGVTCSRNQKSGYVRGDLEIVKPTQ